MPLVSRTFDQLIDFTRTSSATFVGSNGLVQSTPASRNLLTFTQEFDNAAWGQSAVTVTANATAAPDGTNTADKVVENTANSLHTVIRNVTTVAAPYTWSCYIKAAERTFAFLYHVESNAAVSINLLTGATGTPSGTVAPTASTVTSVGNGWYRLTMTATATAALNSFRIYVATSLNGSAVYTGDGTSGIFVWGAQLELGSTATDYTRNFGGLFPPRFDYDPVTLAPRGLLIEEQRTNLLLRSEEFDNAAWTKNRASVTANATTSPDGTVNADKLVEDTASGTHRFFQQASKAASSLTRTFSIYLKAAERTLARIQVSDNTEAVQAQALVDLSAGTIGAVSITGGSTISAGTSAITNAGNGWYRCSITATFDATITNPGAFLFLRDGAGAVTYTGDGTSGIFVWGAQWEDGAFATSYIPTVASTVTRSADNPIMTGTNFSSWYNQSEGTFVVEADATVAVSTNVYRSMAVSDGTVANYMATFQYNTNWGGVGVVGSVSQFDRQPIGSYTSGVPAKVAMAYKANDFAVSVGGSAPLTDTAGSVPTVDRLSIGSVLGAGPLNGHIREIAYFNTRQSNTRLQTLTAPPLVTTLSLDFTSGTYLVGY